jgi:preprotein translocase subunit SecG
MDIFLMTLFIVVCILLVLVVLLQRGRGGGLGAAFGGGTTSAFGTRTGDVFTWVTIVLTGLFLLLAVLTSLAFRPATSTVAAPQFNPPEQEIDQPIRVSAATPTDRAKVHYTLNGSDPTEKDANFEVSGPVTVKPGTTVRARAFRAGWHASSVVSAYYGPKGAASAPAEGELSATMPATAATTAPATRATTQPATAPATNTAP